MAVRRDATLALMNEGDHMLLWCAGGPSIARAVVYPPPLEIAVDGGIYVLDDAGTPEHWQYQFVAHHRRS